MFKLSVYLEIPGTHTKNRRTFTVEPMCIFALINFQICVRIERCCGSRDNANDDIFNFALRNSLNFSVFCSFVFYCYSFDKFVNISYWKKKFRFVKCSLHVHRRFLIVYFFFVALKLYANASPAGTLYVCLIYVANAES